MKWFARIPAGRDFPERIEVVDIAPPGAPLCELELIPESEEGKVVASSTATYVWERKRFSRRERVVAAGFAAAVAAAHFLGVIG